MSVELKLTAKNTTEQRVLDYLLANASDVLAAKINSGTKTLNGALNFAKDEARKLDQSGDCVCVDDATVFGWIVHFFEEESIAEKKSRPAVRVPAGATKQSPPAKPVKAEKAARPAKQEKPVESDPQLSLFAEMMGGAKA
jgi:hypothetical protein